MRRIFTWPRAILLGVAAIGVAAWEVPRMNADKYREPIRHALENALGRSVTLSTVEFRLLPVPGFTVTNVIVGEDPAIGAEPLAYVTTMHARPTFGALLGGELAFASVDLEDTSLNLTRVDRGGSDVRWNFPAFMNPKLLATFPNIHMSGGRVNFKFGDTKSIFYLLNTDVDVWPPARADGPWTLKMRAEPARTDRPSRGFGAFTARGQWAPAEKTVTIDAKLEKSELGDIVTLFEGYESNLHGHISGSAHLAGPITRVGLDGRVAVDEIHGWNQTPPGGGAWPFAISGAINVPGQEINLRAVVAGSAPSPLDLRYRVADYLGHPRWGANAIFTHLPVAPLAAMARNLGASVPQDMSVEGMADGAVGYSYAEQTPRVDGELRIANPALRFTGAPAVKVPEMNMRFDGAHVSMPSVVLTNESGESATLEWDWDVAARDFQASLASEGMSIATLKRQLGAASVPLLGQATSGIWSGKIQNETGKEGWSGTMHLKDAVIPFEAFSEPVRIVQADAVVEGTDFSLQHATFSVGALEGQGDYSYRAAAERPHQFRVAFARADGAMLEHLLLPTVHRGSFLNYAFNFGRVTEPGWMQAMHADGTVQIGLLELGGKAFSRVRAHALWDGTNVRLDPVEARYGDAEIEGTGAIDLSQREPAYSMDGKVAGLPWHGGTAVLDGTLASAGTGSGLLNALSAKGTLRVRGADLGQGAKWDSVQGNFDWDVRAKRLLFTDLTMTRGRETYSGTAGGNERGEVDVKVSGGARELPPFRLALP